MWLVYNMSVFRVGLSRTLSDLTHYKRLPSESINPNDLFESNCLRRCFFRDSF